MVWWKDIDITLDRKHNGDINDLTEIDAVIEALKNIFLTMQGNRRRLPEFALGIYYALFEPIDEITAREIGELLFDAIMRWEPRVIVDDLFIKSKPDQNRYDVTLTFRLKSYKTMEPYTIKQTIQAA